MLRQRSGKLGLLGWTLFVSSALTESFALVPTSTMLVNRHTWLNPPTAFRSALAVTMDSNDSSKEQHLSLLDESRAERPEAYPAHTTRTMTETLAPVWLFSFAMTLGVLFAFGSDAFAETSPLYTTASPASTSFSSSNSLLDELGTAFLFVGDVLGSIINLLYQVILVVVPIIGKAIVAAGKAALPAIKQGLLAFFEYVKVAAQASGEAALPYVDEVKEASTPYLQQVGSLP